jgi:hypothetical protein
LDFPVLKVSLFGVGGVLETPRLLLFGDINLQPDPILIARLGDGPVNDDSGQKQETA